MNFPRISSRSARLAIPLVVVVFLVSCSREQKIELPKEEKKATASVESKNDLLPFLDSLEHRYEAACRQMGIANWNSYSKEAAYDLDSAKDALGKIFDVSLHLIVNFGATVK